MSELRIQTPAPPPRELEADYDEREGTENFRSQAPELRKLQRDGWKAEKASWCELGERVATRRKHDIIETAALFVCVELLFGGLHLLRLVVFGLLGAGTGRGLNQLSAGPMLTPAIVGPAFALTVILAPGPALAIAFVTGPVIAMILSSLMAHRRESIG